jgi:hypothetical protein
LSADGSPFLSALHSPALSVLQHAAVCALSVIESPSLLQIVYVTQLPPDAYESLDHAKMRRTIDKYKRALFSGKGGRVGGGGGLKEELQRLLSYSSELIDVDFAGPDARAGPDPSASPETPAS